VRELRSFIVGMLLMVLLVQFLTGHGSAVVLLTTALLAALAAHLKTVMIAVALPVLLAGGLISVSPWHRDLGARLTTGALLVLAVAVLGDPFLHWFQSQLSTYGRGLFGGQP
jgi:hypothetical protein